MIPAVIVVKMMFLKMIKILRLQRYLPLHQLQQLSKMSQALVVVIIVGIKYLMINSKWKNLDLTMTRRKKFRAVVFHHQVKT